MNPTIQGRRYFPQAHSRSSLTHNPPADVDRFSAWNVEISFTRCIVTCKLNGLTSFRVSRTEPMKAAEGKEDNIIITFTLKIPSLMSIIISKMASRPKQFSWRKLLPNLELKFEIVLSFTFRYCYSQKRLGRFHGQKDNDQNQRTLQSNT